MMERRERRDIPENFRSGVTTWGWAWMRVFVTHNAEHSNDGTVHVDVPITATDERLRLHKVSPVNLYQEIDPTAEAPAARSGWCGPKERVIEGVLWDPAASLKPGQEVQNR